MLEKQGLGENGALELRQVQPLVRAVRAGVGVLDASDEDARPGERLLEFAMNGIEPPVPMSTGAVPPQASARAERAAA